MDIKWRNNWATERVKRPLALWVTVIFSDECRFAVFLDSFPEGVWRTDQEFDVKRLQVTMKCGGFSVITWSNLEQWSIEAGGMWMKHLSLCPYCRKGFSQHYAVLTLLKETLYSWNMGLFTSKRTHDLMIENGTKNLHGLSIHQIKMLHKKKSRTNFQSKIIWDCCMKSGKNFCKRIFVIWSLTWLIASLNWKMLKTCPLDISYWHNIAINILLECIISDLNKC